MVKSRDSESAKKTTEIINGLQIEELVVGGSQKRYPSLKIINVPLEMAATELTRQVRLANQFIMATSVFEIVDSYTVTNQKGSYRNVWPNVISIHVMLRQEK